MFFGQQTYALNGSACVFVILCFFDSVSWGYSYHLYSITQKPVYRLRLRVG